MDSVIIFIFVLGATALSILMQISNMQARLFFKNRLESLILDLKSCDYSDFATELSEYSFERDRKRMLRWASGSYYAEWALSLSIMLFFRRTNVEKTSPLHQYVSFWRYKFWLTIILSYVQHAFTVVFYGFPVLAILQSDFNILAKLLILCGMILLVVFVYSKKLLIPYSYWGTRDNLKLYLVERKIYVHNMSIKEALRSIIHSEI